MGTQSDLENNGRWTIRMRIGIVMVKLYQVVTATPENRVVPGLLALHLAQGTTRFMGPDLTAVISISSSLTLGQLSTRRAC